MFVWLRFEGSVGRLSWYNRPVVEEMRVELLFGMFRAQPHLAIGLKQRV